MFSFVNLITVEEFLNLKLGLKNCGVKQNVIYGLYLPLIFTKDSEEFELGGTGINAIRKSDC